MEQTFWDLYEHGVVCKVKITIVYLQECPIYNNTLGNYYMKINK